MQKIPVSSKLTLVFGLDWAQHDPLTVNLRQQVKQWKNDGFTFAAQYKHDRGLVFGRTKDSASQLQLDKTCISGAAVIATNPSLAGKTALVLIGFEAPDGSTKVIFVGLRTGVVKIDLVIDPSQVGDQINEFRKLLSGDKSFRTYGEISGNERVDERFAFSQLTPAKGAGKARPITVLRTPRAFKTFWVLGLIGALGSCAYFVIQYNENAAAEMKQRLAMQENAPPVLYEKEIKRWLARPVAFVSPSLEFLRDKLSPKSFDVVRAGWILESITCANDQCSSLWRRDVGTLEDFKAAAPPEWAIVPAGQEKLSAVLDFKLPTQKIDPSAWPKPVALRDKLFTHWQYLSDTGWKATLDVVKQLAIPAHWTKEQQMAVANFPKAPHGIAIEVVNQSWWLAQRDRDAPLNPENFAEQVELTEPLVVTYDGKEFSFSFKGLIYVSTN